VLIENRILLTLIKSGGGMCPMKPGNRQYNFYIEMVPIHAKRLLWEMGERNVFYDAFLPMQMGFFFFKKE
jgi:hypothetical protein